MTSHVVHIDDIDSREFGNGKRFGSKMKRLGGAAGGVRLGCTLYEVPPQKAAFPFHAHLGIEEAVYILEGTGTLRLGDEEHPVRPGSYAAFPPGREMPHQLINTGEGPLRYLCFSDDSDPEMVVYPDSKKVAAMAGGWPPKVRVMIREDTEMLDYFDGEEG